MKKVLLTTFCLGCAFALTVQAADEKKPERKRPERTAEQKALLKEITAKYDANKDGKLSKEERAKISTEDQKKLAKAGLGPKTKKEKK